MLNEKQEEIMEAIWGSAENGRHNTKAIKGRCVVDFSEEDLLELEKQGLVELNGDNTFTYAPESDYTGSDIFYYTSDDGIGGTN